jgi:hypothetical protein
MSFFDLEVLKEKPINSKRIMPPFKTFKKMLLEQKNCNSDGPMKICSNFNIQNLNY